MHRQRIMALLAASHVLVRQKLSELVTFERQMHKHAHTQQTQHTHTNQQQTKKDKDMGFPVTSSFVSAVLPLLEEVARAVDEASLKSPQSASEGVWDEAAAKANALYVNM